QLQGIGRPEPGLENGMRVVWVMQGCIAAIPVAWELMATAGATVFAWLLGLLFVGLAAALLVAAVGTGNVQTRRVVAMLIIFTFNVMFWMFFEQAGSSFNFLAQNIVDRDLSGWTFPVGWFQSVNPVSIVLLAPVMVLIWGFLDKRGIEPSIPRKFGL